MDISGILLRGWKKKENDLYYPMHSISPRTFFCAFRKDQEERRE